MPVHLCDAATVAAEMGLVASTTDLMDSAAADRAVSMRSCLGVPVVHAQLAAVIAATPGPHAVVTSADDLGRTLPS